MGYIIFLNECPVYWQTKLLKIICLSTLEVEYASCSISLKTLLPLKQLLEEIVAVLHTGDAVTASVRANVFEDNQGALLLAQNHRVTNRTKYFLLKWHWFWSFAEHFTFRPIESKKQRADFLTKGLPRESFENNRLPTMGW
jgi:hypothetical protein